MQTRTALPTVTCLLFASFAVADIGTDGRPKPAAAMTDPAADVVLDFRAKAAAATTRPAADDAALTVLAVPGHAFEAKFQAGGRTVEASGSVQPPADGRYRVTLRLAETHPGLPPGSLTSRVVKTTLEVTAGQAAELSGLQVGDADRTVVVSHLRLAREHVPAGDQAAGGRDGAAAIDFVAGPELVMAGLERLAVDLRRERPVVPNAPIPDPADVAPVVRLAA